MALLATDHSLRAVVSYSCLDPSFCGQKYFLNSAERSVAYFSAKPTIIRSQVHAVAGKNGASSADQFINRSSIMAPAAAAIVAN